MADDCLLAMSWWERFNGAGVICGSAEASEGVNECMATIAAVNKKRATMAGLNYESE
jgi:hypothetical protein